MKKPNILFIGALCSMILISLANADISERNGERPAVVEETVKKTYVLQPGEKEYLSPNLIGVQNIAITNIPVAINFINIIDAYREIVDGVRYEIVLNAVNTTDNNTEIICRIVVLEKPWLTTLWGDKVRLLQESNCTSEELPDSSRNRKALEEKYETNAIFSGRNELTTNDMINLESQIIGSSKNPQIIRQRTANPLPTTTESFVSTTGYATESSVDNVEQTNLPIQLETSTANDNGRNELEAVVSSSSESTTTEKIPELNDSEKKWLDDFLSIGAYNFESSLEKKKTQSDINEAQESNKNSKRALVGGPKQFSPEEVAAHQETLSKSLEKISSLSSSGVPKYNIDKCLSGSSQVVAGSLVTLDCDMVHKETGEKDRCLMSLWSRPWIKENGYEVTFECNKIPKSKHRYSRSVEDKKTLNGVRKLNDLELKEQVGIFSESLAKIASGDGPSYSILRAFNGTKQTVAGKLVKIYIELLDGNTGAKENCTLSLWSRPWIRIDGNEVSIECENRKTVHRHSRSIEYTEKKNFKKSHRSMDKAELLFEKFQIQYKKQYHNSMERQMRLRIFNHNLKLIHDLNKNELGSAKYGITEFADMTTTEYRDRTGLLSREGSSSVRSPAEIPNVDLPKEFDWREKGAISKVKNQGSCGSCWAFSVTGNIEGLHAVKTGKLEEYSEQELLDCDTIDSACNGGLPDDAYKAIENIGGLELESEYPYEAKKRQCNFNKTLAHVKIAGAVDLPKNETEMAKWLIVNGPISIGINANAMQFYRGGVSHPWKILCSKKSLDHGVLIVGYGVSEYPSFNKTLPYWIVKNSWGPKWGEQGYYRVYRGDNTCGVSEMATSAVLA